MSTAHILMMVIPLVIVQFTLLITAILSLVKKEVRSEDKILWALLIVFVGTFGPIIYFAVGSNLLDQKAAELEEKEQERYQ